MIHWGEQGECESKEGIQADFIGVIYIEAVLQNHMVWDVIVK